MVVCAGSLTFTFRSKVIFELKKIFMKLVGTLSCNLQSKIPNSAAERTCERVYMASKVDCKCVGNEVGVAA